MNAIWRAHSEHFRLSPDQLTRARRLGREFIWVGAGQALAVIGSLVGVRLLTDVLAPAVSAPVQSPPP